MAQNMALGSPVRCDGFSNGSVVRRSVRVDVASIRKLSAGRAVDAMDLGVGEALQGGQPQLFRQSVDLGMSQQFFAALVQSSIRLFLLRLGHCVVPGVLKLQKTPKGRDVLVREANTPLVIVPISISSPTKVDSDQKSDHSPALMPRTYSQSQ